ncbi:MAG: hypothetical protein PHX62_09725, partial [Bacilli bacterium]|nr:hypothetical protein [Bacilli bacterium]
ITYCVTNYIQSRQIATTTQAITRTIEVKKNEIDYQSIFDEFEDVKIDINENITSFEGTKTFNLVDFEELDLVSDSNVDTRLKVKYSYAFDSEQNIVSLSATLLNEGGTEIVDTMIGVPFVDENGNFDAVFDCDGELLLLSELREAGMIENCGWLKNLCKKVANVAKKVVKNVATFVYENADVIVPLAIGIIGGLTGGAVIPILIAGSVAGAAIDGTKTAVQTYQETGKVDWAATGISAGIGAAVGAIATYTGYSIGSALRSETNKTNTENVKKYNTYGEFTKENGSANNSGLKYGTTGANGTYEWHHIVEQNQVSNSGITAQNIYSTQNTISLGYETHRQISGIYSSYIENLSKYNIDGLKQLFSNTQEGQTVRSYLLTLSFEEQYGIGIKILRLLGVKI